VAIDSGSQAIATPSGLSIARFRAISQPALSAALICALLAFGVVCFAPQVLNDGDTYWHVAAGQWMLQYGQIPQTDPYSFTFAGQPWHDHEWLAEIALALAYQGAGWAGAVILAGAFAAATFGLLGWRVRRQVPTATTAVILALTAFCYAPSLLVRPHLLVSPLIVLWTFVLMDARALGRAPSLWWLGLILLWTNLHGSVILGLGLIAPFALEALLAAGARWRRVAVEWGLFGAGAGAAALCNPRGLEGLVYSVMLPGMKAMTYMTEWNPPNFQAMPPLEIALMTALFALLARGVRIPPVRLALILGLLHLALGHERHQVVLALIAAPILAEALSGARAGGIPAGEAVAKRPNLALVAGAGLFFGALAVLRLTQPAPIRDKPSTPVTALAQVPAAVRALPVLNDFNAGGYLIFNGVRTFIDSRTDMYGDAFNTRYMAILRGDRKALTDALAQYRIGWTLLPPNSAVAAEMDAMPGWRRLYSGPYSVVHVRTANP
jgi:hypothetical protein